jgi:rod shape-determining protein MreC
VAGFTSTRTDSATDLLSGPRDIQTAREEIAQLEAKIDSLERENEELREDQGELQVLQGLFNRARQSPEFSRQIATVIGYDTSPAVRSIIIDKGSADGITVGMPVEGARGLVGRVFRTAPNSAQVALITDNASAIPARLGNTRATGVLSGSGLGGPLTMDWIDVKFNIEVGEVVLTSGLGGNFPQDIVVGQVIEVDHYVAEVLSAGPELCRVRFLRGGEHSIGVDEVRPASFLPGERLVANWPMWGPWTSTVVAYDERHRVLTVSDGWGSDAHISLIDVWLSPKDVADVDRRHLTVKLLVWGAAAGGILGSALTWFLLR